MRDVKVHTLGEAPQPLIYFPIAQRQGGDLYLVARGRPEPPEIAAMLRRMVRETNPRLLIMETKTMEENLSVMLFPARMAALGQAFTMDWWYLLPLALTDRLGGSALWSLVLVGGAVALGVPWWICRGRAQPAGVSAERCSPRLDPALSRASSPSTSDMSSETAW